MSTDRADARGPGRPQIGSGYKLPVLPIDDDLRDRIRGHQAGGGIKKTADAVRELLEMGLAAADRGTDAHSAALRVREALSGLEAINPEAPSSFDHTDATGSPHWQISGQARSQVRFFRADDLEALLNAADQGSAS